MLQLKHLYDNRPLAHMLLENWDYDRSRPEFLDQFRISSNAVYPFYRGGHVCFLRFTPAEENSAVNILAELDFLSFLKRSGYPAVETVPSKNDRDLEVSDTPWGTYSAVVFKGVPGRRLDGMQPTEDIIYILGKSLGQLHDNGSRYKPTEHKRQDWLQRLDWAGAILRGFPEETAARDEESFLRSCFSRFEVNAENFGLVHYDFEPDNLFYDEQSGTVYPIDFDDAVYHWYVMDIVQALESLRETLPEGMSRDAARIFLEGYRSQKATDDALLLRAPIFSRYANLFSYTRILNAIAAHTEGEPEWMLELRAHLERLLTLKKMSFGGKEPTRL